MQRVNDQQTLNQVTMWRVMVRDAVGKSEGCRGDGDSKVMIWGAERVKVRSVREGDGEE